MTCGVVDTYVEDLAELLEALDLTDAILVGHSTSGGVVARYIGRGYGRGPGWLTQPPATVSGLVRLEPMTGIEPAYSAWEADVLPLNYIGEVDDEG
jgi:alpha-beta hydrolase superfamily lysophospholipase